MTLIEKIKSEINVTELRKNDRFGIFEDSTDAQVIDSELYAEIAASFKKSCEEETNQFINSSRSGIERSSKYIIVLDSMIDSLRELYKQSRNQFVKDVIATIGKSKTFTSKQLEVVVDEIIKINFNLNF